MIFYTAIAYDQLRIQIINELNEYVEERKHLKTYSDNFQKKGDQTSDYYYKKWALWVHQEDHVAQWLIHSEGFHTVVNESFGSKRSFMEKLKSLIEYTMQHTVDFPTRKGSSLKRRKNAYKWYFFLLCKQYCVCSDDVYLSYLYGFDIACPHQIFYEAKDFLQETQNEMFETMQVFH